MDQGVGRTAHRAVGVALVAWLLGAAPVGAQTVTTEHQKVLITSTAGDALDVDGGALVSGTVTVNAGTPLVLQDAATTEIMRVVGSAAPSVIYRPGNGGDHIWQSYLAAPLGRLTDDPQLYLGDEASNADCSVCLTVQQGAADDLAVALKSSDVGHPMTAIAEADTYGAASKASGPAGGLRLFGYRDADGAAGLAVDVVGYLGELADTTTSTAGIGVIQLQGWVTNGGTGATAVAAAGNLLSVSNAGAARALVKGNGDAWFDGDVTIDAITIDGTDGTDGWVLTTNGAGTVALEALPAASDELWSGAIQMSNTSCPGGWTRLTALDNRFPRGAASYGGTGGADTHTHDVTGSTAAEASHTHDVDSGSQSTGGPSATGESYSSGSPFFAASQAHTHQINLSVTSGAGSSHSHGDGTLAAASGSNVPAYLNVIYCVKS